MTAPKAALAFGLLILSQGCTYLQHRAEDAVDMLDVGLTWSNEPGFALYSNTPILLPIGWSCVDGYVAGIGGGVAGMTSHYHHCTGLLLWGEEETAWHQYDVRKPATLNHQGVGPLAALIGPYGNAAYVPAWTNYLHLGYVGVLFNMRYMDFIDFLLGWFGADLAQDDGRATHQWPWEEKPQPRAGALSAPPGR
ncbi:MAG TPA: hypothetical protein PLE19_22120 [Planctomycetota bacterium]|nr:hypothetical protein [Planctomycetota bacterium]HRR82404.1 hypothetical protein [Planctomycetota bacterium]HRT97780.1 hypothetical protein [Planctomycetota bacterium]